VVAVLIYKRPLLGRLTGSNKPQRTNQCFSFIGPTMEVKGKVMGREMSGLEILSIIA
jgi:hypothetical protein